MSGFWWVEPEWAGETCVIAAGGCSLTSQQLDRVRGAGLKTIVVNDAYRLAPWAEVLFFYDPIWWSWHREALQDWPGRIVRLESPEGDGGHPRARVLKNYGTEGFIEARDGVMNGRNSGYGALHLAAHLGVARVLLLGFDCKRGEGGRKHWFGEHPNRSDQPHNIWIACFNQLAPILAARGIEVINCSPGSALTCFKREPLESVLPDPAATVVPA